MSMVVCPKCKSTHVSQILYGMPTHEAFKMAERGELILGGCMIMPGQPDYGCLDCKFQWSKRSLLSTAIKKIRVKLIDNGLKCLDDVENIVYEIHANGKAYKYTYRGGGRKYTEREEKRISEDILLGFYEKIQGMLQMNVDDIEFCRVCDGMGFVLRVSYIDGRTEIVEGDVGGGTLDSAIIKFFGEIFEEE